MIKRVSPAVIVVIAIIVLAAVFLAFNRHQAKTRDQAEERVRDLLTEYVSVPLASDLPLPTIDIQFELTDDDTWNADIRTSNFRFAGQDGDSKNMGSVLVVIDGKAHGFASEPLYPLGNISGNHILTFVLTDDERHLYRFNALPVRKTVRGVFSKTGFTPDYSK